MTCLCAGTVPCINPLLCYAMVISLLVDISAPLHGAHFASVPIRKIKSMAPATIPIVVFFVII